MRVLLIEDDSATAQSIELMLQSEGFNVYTTDLGEEGVDLGKLYDYDIILLDLNLPDMSGYEVLKTLRVSKVQTPILILSGRSTRTSWSPGSMPSSAGPRVTPSR
jgi:two-component system, cell cycle response regulator CtrA